MTLRKQSNDKERLDKQKEYSMTKGQRLTWVLKKRRKNQSCTRRRFWWSLQQTKNVLKLVCWKYNKDKDKFTWPPHHSWWSFTCMLAVNSWNSKNVLKNILQLTKSSFFASLHFKERKHTHMGCFMEGQHSWLCLWSMKFKASIKASIPPLCFSRAYKQEYIISQSKINCLSHVNINQEYSSKFFKLFNYIQTNFYSYTRFGS
jgi:hypothetical protein